MKYSYLDELELIELAVIHNFKYPIILNELSETDEMIIDVLLVRKHMEKLIMAGFIIQICVRSAYHLREVFKKALNGNEIK